MNWASRESMPPVATPERPDAGARHQQEQRRDQAGRRRHQPEGHDPVGKGMPRRAEHREGGHVRPKEGREEDVRPDGSPGEEVLLGAFVRPTVAEREDADVEHDREIAKDDEGRQHGWVQSRSRCEGQMARVRYHISPAQARAYSP